MNDTSFTCFLCGEGGGGSVKSREGCQRQKTNEVLMNLWEERCMLSLCRLLRIPATDPAVSVLLTASKYCATCEQLIRDVDFSLGAIDNLHRQILHLRQLVVFKLQSKAAAELHLNKDQNRRPLSRQKEQSHLQFRTVFDRVQEEQVNWTKVDFFSYDTDIKIETVAVAGDELFTDNESVSSPPPPEAEWAQIKMELSSDEDEEFFAPADDRDTLTTTGSFEGAELNEDPLIVIPAEEVLLEDSPQTSSEIKIEIDLSVEDPSDSDYSLEKEEKSSDEEYLPAEISSDSEVETKALKPIRTYPAGRNKRLQDRKLGIQTNAAGRLDEKPVEKKRKVWFCPHACPLKFLSRLDYYTHIQDKHPKAATSLRSSRHNCDQCGKSFHSIAFLKHHENIHRKEDRRRTCKACSFCGLWFKNEEITDHESLHQAHECPFSCFLCPEVKFLGPFQLSNHIKETHPIEFREKMDLIICKLCGEDFVSKLGKFGIEEHMKAVHSRIPKSFPCDKCKKVFKFGHRLAKHKNLVHIDPNEMTSSLMCETCGKIFKVEKDLINHRKRHSDNLGFSCKICGKAFKLKGDVRKHEEVHAGLQFKCPDCPKMFSTTRYLQQHSRCHLPREQRKYYYKTKQDTSRSGGGGESNAEIQEAEPSS